jgi:putative tricarboxylic transport membrane protein
MEWGAIWQGLMMTLAPASLGGMAIGLAIGLVFGAVPGLTATLGIVLVLPFIWGMDPYVAFAILLAMISATQTSNTFPAFYFNVPGTPTAAATVLDGYPMAKKGEAARGLVASFVASAVGGVIAAIVIFALLPVLRPLVLAFGSPEQFMLVMLGVIFVAVLSGERIVQGLLAGLLGLLLGTVGQDPQLGFMRFTFGVDYLMEGFNIVPIVMGLFALPEVIALGVRGQIAERTAVRLRDGLWTGVRDVVRHWTVTLRGSLLGVLIGAMPGLGGTAAAFYAYAATVQAAKPEERQGFGKGDVRGVIAPESANNASAGGEMIPLLAFGVPGGATSALLLSAFLILGVSPGPDMLGKNLPLSYSMVFVLVFANLAATLVCIAVTDWTARIAWVRGTVIIPIVLAFVLFGAYAGQPNWQTLVVTLGFGLLGYAMMLANWSRVPLLLGVILGPLLENNLTISLAAFGPSFLLRPIPLTLLVVMSGFLGYALLRRRRRR